VTLFRENFAFRLACFPPDTAAVSPLIPPSTSRLGCVNLLTGIYHIYFEKNDYLRETTFNKMFLKWPEKYSPNPVTI
jgi:hypothetical protein